MKFTLNWLKTFLITQASLTEISNSLTDIGLEVEEIFDPSVKLKDFKVAEIINTRAHPSSSKLHICDVRIQSAEILQIICGAVNARAGIKVILAPIGSVIPHGNMKIKEAEIRGVKSYGMLCSETELELGSDNSGIIEVPFEFKLGDLVANVYGLSDPIIHINVTPNRSDALSVYGIARDLAARGIGTLKNIESYESKNDYKANTTALENKEACSGFLLREIRGIDNKAATPIWLTNFLKAIGVKSISAVVDITNYILYSYGQPLHAYDADKLNGNLKVEILTKEASFKALDEKEYLLKQGDLVIQDDTGIECLAGIIGGYKSAISTHTNKIILEAAIFEAEHIIKTGRRLKIETDARYRFERGIDANFTEKALNLASNLIIEICGGELSQIVGANKVGSVKIIHFDTRDLLKVTGLDLASTKIINILESLGFGLTIIDEHHLRLKVPSWGHSINIKEDIIEEIIRIYGYDKIEGKALPNHQFTSLKTRSENKISEVRREVANLGYNEIISYSFISKALTEIFSTVTDDLKLVNPISADLSHLRPSLLPNLLEAVSHNLARSIKEIALFELGPVFSFSEKQSNMLSAVKICQKKQSSDEVFRIKTDLACSLAAYGLDINKCKLLDLKAKGYHPTRSASLQLGPKVMAHFGQIHPQVLHAIGIEHHEIVFFEVFIDNLPISKAKFGRREKLILSDYQMNQRDFAFVVDKDQKAGDMVNFIQNLNNDLIKQARIFDIYAGFDNKKKSIAISVQIQAIDRTLNENELNTLSDEIISKVSAKFNASLRA